MIIVGVMRVHPDHLHLLKWTLQPFLNISNRQLFMFQDVCPDVIKGLGLPEDAIILHWEGVRGACYDWRSSMDTMLKEVDKLRPDWVVAPDADEILPVRGFYPLVDRCEAEGKSGVFYRFAELIGGFDYQLNPAQVAHGPHLRLMRWRPNLTFHGTAGFGIPAGDYATNSIHSPEPLIHLSYLTEEARTARRAVGRTTSFDASPQLVRAPPEWAELYNKGLHL